MRGTALVGLTVLAVATSASPQAVRTHDLPLKVENVRWGYFDARVAPAIRIAAGDRIRVETMIAGGLQRLRMTGVQESEIPESMKSIELAVTDRLGAHPLTGPIYIEGAEPGDVLEVRILDISFLHSYGIVAFRPGGGTLPGEFPYAYTSLMRWNMGDAEVRFAPNVTLRFAPFFGTIGVAPPILNGRISSTAPGWHGGNLDNKDLVAGTTLYLPVHTAGALLSIGDGHAMQGDGEVSGTALETSLRGTFEVRLLKGRRWRWPRAESPTHYFTMGLDEDLDEAARMAVREMIDFLVTEKGLTRDQAYVLSSLSVDLRITQLVDLTKGVHAALPKAVIR